MAAGLVSFPIVAYAITHVCSGEWNICTAMHSPVVTGCWCRWTQSTLYLYDSVIPHISRSRPKHVDNATSGMNNIRAQMPIVVCHDNT